MKKSILSIGKALSKVEQKQVFGGYASEDPCVTGEDMDKGCLCVVKEADKCSSGSCNGNGGTLGLCA